MTGAGSGEYVSPLMLRRLLAQLHACRDGVDSIRASIGGEAAWKESRRGDLMIWLCNRLHVDDHLMARVAVRCVSLALDHVGENDADTRAYMEKLMAWVSDPTAERLEAIQERYDEMFKDRYPRISSTVLDAVLDAGRAVLCGAEAAVDAIDNGAYIFDEDGFLYTSDDYLAECADIVREVIPFAVILEAARPILEKIPTKGEVS